MEKVLLYDKAVEFKSRTYGLDASLTEMLWTEPSKDFDPRPIDCGFSGPNLGSGLSGPSFEPMEPIMEPVGKSYGLPGDWGAPQEYGLNGPGEARTVFPGLIERQRIDIDGHNGYGPHINKEYYSIFQVNKKGNLKVLNNDHIDID